MEKKIAIINGQEVEITVLPPVSKSPRELRMKNAGAHRVYVTQKERAAQLQKAGLKKASTLSAYELAVRYGIEQETITESEYLHQNARNVKTKVRLEEIEL